MKITFDINQVEAYALNEARYSELYSLMRSYFGIPVGNYWSAEEFEASLRADLIVYDEDDGGVTEPFWSVRGQQFNCSTSLHSISVRQAMLALKLSLRALHTEGSAVCFKNVKTCKKQLVELLARTEW